MSRATQYAELVAQRKAFDPTALGLRNPAEVENGRFDSDHIGPWTVWAHDLNADLMVVGQDWGDVNYFIENQGRDKPANPTNKALQHLLLSVGRPLPSLASQSDISNEEAGTCRVWLTNALLWLKDGGLSAPVRADWFNQHSAALLRAQIEIVEPRIVVALGARAYDAVLAAYALPKRTGVFRKAVDDGDGVRLVGRSTSSTLLAAYHCGARIQNTFRSLTQQLKDWQRVSAHLNGR